MDNNFTLKDNDETKQSSTSSPLSPELGDKRRKKHSKNKKRLKVTLRGWKYLQDSKLNPSSSEKVSNVEGSRISEGSNDIEGQNSSQRNFLAPPSLLPVTDEVTHLDNVNISPTSVSGAQRLTSVESGCEIKGENSASESVCMNPNETHFPSINDKNMAEDAGISFNTNTMAVTKHKHTIDSHNDSSRRVKQRIICDKDEFQTSSDIQPLGTLNSIRSDSELVNPSELNFSRNDDNDISFSVLEEICQSTELSFKSNSNLNTSSNENEAENYYDPYKAVRVSHSDSSPKKERKDKKNLVHMFENTCKNSNEKVENCVNNIKLTSRILFDRKKNKPSIGSIYVNNSSDKNEPVFSSVSIKSLLEHAKLLDDTESISYLKETNKQKEFKLICKKEKLNNGNYLCFENLPNNDKRIKQDSKATPSSIPMSQSNVPIKTASANSKYEPANSDGNLSLMEKYNIDMNNTLNIFSECLDDVMNEAESIICENKVPGSICHKTNSDSSYKCQETETSFDKAKENNRKLACKKDLPSTQNRKSIFSEISPKISEKRSVKPVLNINCCKNDIPSEQIEKDNLRKKSIERKSNIEIGLEESTSKKIITEMNCDLPNNEQESNNEKFALVSDDVLQNRSLANETRSFNSELCAFSTANRRKISEEALTEARSILSEKDISDTSYSGIFADTIALPISQQYSAKESGLISEKERNYIDFSCFSSAKRKSITINEESMDEKSLLSDNVAIDLPLGGFSTANGKSIYVSESALAKSKSLLSVNEISDVPFTGLPTANEKSLSIYKETLSKAKTMLRKNKCSEGIKKANYEDDLDGGKSMLAEKEIFDVSFSGVSTSDKKTLFVSENGLTESRTFHTDNENTNTPFTGFSTAKGKSISVSEDALAKAKSLLSECVDADVSFSGFSTANSKSLSVSKDALAKARTLMTKEENANSCFNGFSTANGKSISVSEDALAKAKSLLSECDNPDVSFSGYSTAKGKSLSVSKDELAKARAFQTDNQSTNTPFTGFSTAKGKYISVSEDALAKAKTLLSECDNPDVSFSGFSPAKGNSLSVSKDALAKARTLMTEEGNSNSCFNGFSTANGKSISVSEDALAKAKLLLSECDNTDVSFSGYSTAKGKSLSVSKDALAKARTLMTEEDNSNSCFNGFSTANGKSISVSEGALAKAKSLLSECDNPDVSFSGFSTGKGKSISLSKDALSKSSALLTDDECSNAQFNGFSTANGKSISVSEDALAKAKSLLSECDNPDVSFSGFSTAKGKSLSVSKDALAKARAFQTDNESTNTPFTGFSTAKGKFISVSEGALAKAKSLLFECDNPDVSFSGFSTGKGKSISLSKDALSKSSALLTDDECSNAQFNGFSTANEKSISVSEDALAKARDLLTEKESLVSPFNDFSSANYESISFSDDPLAKSRTLFSSNNFTESPFSGFSTANGKSISVSEEALVKASHILMDETSIPHNENITTSNNASMPLDGNVLCHQVINPSPSLKSFPLKSKLQLEQHSSTKENSVDSVFDSKLLESCSNLAVQCCAEPMSQCCPIKTPSLQTQYYEDIPCISLSFVDEVSESTAAFLADEDISEMHDPPGWLKTFVTSPSVIHDRSRALSPILCSDSSRKSSKKRACSPILGQGDRFKKRKKRLMFSKRCFSKQSAECKTPEPNSKAIDLSDDPYNSFFSNLKTSTPISVNRTRSKRLILDEDSSLSVEKKPKIMDSWDDSQVDQTMFLQLDVLEGRRQAAVKQESLLKNGKEKALLKMRKGKLFLKKQQENRIPLKSLVKFPRRNLSPAELLRTGIKQSIIDVTYSNSDKFRFNSSNSLPNEICQSNCEGISVGDDALVILSDDGSAGLKEISRAFLASPGIDPSLITDQWTTNHYKSIVWKLASIERSFPHVCAGVCLTLDNVLLQLKYRYDREIDSCQRSCLRKILETDESAIRRMVLCVSNIAVIDTSATKELDLTDGWYSIKASVDEEMVGFIAKGKVAVGTKLVVQGCELLNCKQGHDPLLVPNTVQLKIHSNSSRRARWDSRLGFCHIQGPICIRLKDILPKGGNVGRVDVLIVRVYPLVYLFKTESGKTVLFSRKREEQESLSSEQKMSELMEKLQSQVQKEMDEGSDFKSNSRQKRHGEESFSAQHLFESDQILTRDQMESMNNLREREQRRYQETLQKRLEEKLNESGSGKRNSIPMLKVRVLDPQSNEIGDTNLALNTAMLTVWKPTEDVENVLTEGNVVSLYNITAQGKRSGELQLSTGRQTKYSVSSKSEAFKRTVHRLSDISQSFNPLFSEMNTVGLVIHVETSSSVDIAYLSDQNSNFLGVRFWGGMKKFGWQHCVTVGSEIACSNLEWRINAVTWHIPCAFVSEFSIFSANPRSKKLQEALAQFKMDLEGMNLNEFISESKEKLKDILDRGETKKSGSTINESKRCKNVIGMSDGVGKNHNECNDLEPASSETTSSNSNFMIKSPISNFKSKLLLEKMHKLHGYGNPPPITSMSNLQVSPALKKDFKTPNRRQVD